MKDRKGSRLRRIQGIAVLGVLAIAMAGALGWVYVGQHTYRVKLRPGETVTTHIEIPMTRHGVGRHFAKEFNLPVFCRVDAPGRDGLQVSVTEAGHKISRMWATVVVRATYDATPGKRARRATFTIDGEGGWPVARLIIDVRPLDRQADRPAKLN